MTPLFTANQEMFFVILTLVFIVALIGDFSKARFFRSIGRMPDTRNELDKATKLFMILLVVFMAWAQDKDSQQSSGNGDWLSGETLEAIESEYYYSLPEEESGITWALLTGNPPFTSNAVLTASQFQAGFACVSVTAIQPSALAAPANAVTFTNWPYAVARQSVLLPQGCLPQGFTFGGRTVTNLYMAASGMLSFDGPKSSPIPATNGIPDGTALNYIAVLQTPSDIVPTNGIFWYVTGTNSSVFTWKDVYLGQDTNCLATVQAELYANGDFTCRYSFPSPTYSYSSIPEGLLIGAQNNGGGETVLHTNNLLAVHSAFMSAFELRWKSLTGLNPAVADQDDDSLSTADELFIHRTDPRRKDSDGDGLTDPVEIVNATDPRNPDTNNDGVPDGIDLTGYSLSDTNLVFKLINNIAPSVDPNLDTDNDGWADWLEVRFGTDTNYFYSTPEYSDAFFSVTVTLATPPPETGVLAVGTNRVLVVGSGSWTFWRIPGEAHPVSFTSPHGVPPSFQITLNRPSAARYDIPQPAGKDGSFGKVALPLITFDPEICRCCHEARTEDFCETYTAIVTPQMPGTYAWETYGWDWYLTGTTWTTNATNAVSAGHDIDWIRLRFTPFGASAYRESWVPVNTHCSMAGVDTNNPDRVAVNNNDDDADGSLDNADTEITVGDPDLQPLWPLGRFDGFCCQCPEHHPIASAATLAATSQKLALYTDSYKTNAFSGTVHAGESVHVEGLAPSTEPYAEKIVWQWTEDNETKSLTNALTVLSVRLWGDFNLDGEMDAADIAGLASISPDNGWLMPAATNVLRKLRLRTDVGLSGGAYTLTLSGDAGAFRVWADDSGTNATPLLVCGQTVTNGVNGVTFLVGDDSDLYVETAESGTATLAYAYTGTGDATNISSFAELKMTSCGISISPKGRVTFAGSTTNVLFSLEPGSWTNCVWTISSTASLLADGPVSEPIFSFYVGTNVWVNPGILATNFTITCNAREFPSLHANAGLIVSREINRVPSGNSVYIWNPNPEDAFASSFIGALADENHYQGWSYSTTNPVTRFVDSNPTDDDCETCTLANLKSMAQAGIVVMLTHGETGSVEVVSFSSQGAANTWKGQEDGMYVIESATNAWIVYANSAWFQSNWKSSLDQNNAIVFLGVCHSVDGYDNIATNVGGKTVFGAHGSADGYVVDSAFKEIIQFMNGTLSTRYRNANRAYENISSFYKGTVKLMGDGLNTLCPAPQGVFPLTGIEKTAGWGCILFDSFMDTSVSANIAVVPSIGTIGVRSWGGNFSGSFYIEFPHSGAGVSVEAVSDKCRSAGGQQGRPLDGDGIAPMPVNGQSKEWSW